MTATLTGGARPQPATTLFEVERDARWRIWALFGLLVVSVWVCLAPLSLLLAALLHIRQRGSVFSTAYWAYPSLGSATVLEIFVEAAALAVTLGLVVAAVAWLATRINARARLVKALGAATLDPDDTYHHRLDNVVDELRIAAGLTRLDRVVVPALTVNAVSFAGARGPACVGVTEGALSRLSRPQLQAVVAHEVAHVASRDCVVATRACLLFLGVRRIADAYGKLATIAMLAGYVAVCFVALVPLKPVQTGLFWALMAVIAWTAVWLSFWIAIAGASVVQLALSRQREYAADAAAVRFTGDPASLAEALQMVEWQQSGVSTIPPGLASLCIAPAGVGHDFGWRSWFESHPPLAERIARLQALAHQQGQSLWERRIEVERRLKAREHVVPARVGLRGAADRAAPDGVVPDRAAPGRAVPGRAVPGRAVPGRVAPGRAARLAAAADGEAVCPCCAGRLHRLVYEGSSIIECTVCGGVGATTPQVESILARRDWGFTPDQERTADLIERYDAISPSQTWLTGGRRLPPLPLPWTHQRAETSCCPLCEAPMRRAPWSLAYPLPTDYCGGCDLHWFDRDEIEVLQILVERRTA